LVPFVVEFTADYPDVDTAPFDGYSLSIPAFVIDTVTNEPIPIITFTVGQAPDSFDISSVEAATTSNYTYDSGTGPTTITVHSKIVHVEVKRSRFAQALTISLLLVNWALTAASIYIMVLVVFRKERMDSVVLLLPVTIILTIPTLRSLYPGPLPLGIYIGKSRAPTS